MNVTDMPLDIQALLIADKVVTGGFLLSDHQVADQIRFEIVGNPVEEEVISFEVDLDELEDSNVLKSIT